MKQSRAAGPGGVERGGRLCLTCQKGPESRGLTTGTGRRAAPCVWEPPGVCPLGPEQAPCGPVPAGPGRVRPSRVPAQRVPSHSRLSCQVDQSGLGLPSRDFYLNKTENEKVSGLLQGSGSSPAHCAPRFVVATAHRVP